MEQYRLFVKKVFQQSIFFIALWRLITYLSPHKHSKSVRLWEYSKGCKCIKSKSVYAAKKKKLRIIFDDKNYSSFSVPHVGFIWYGTGSFLFTNEGGAAFRHIFFFSINKCTFVRGF